MDSTRMINAYEREVISNAQRMSEIEQQIEVIKKCLAGTQRSAGYLWVDEELSDLKPLINPNLFDDVYVEKSI